MEIREASVADAEAIAAIYNHYVRTSVITFEEEPVSASEMANRIQDVQLLSLPWYAAVETDSIVGYAYASAWKSRSGYRYSAEVTAYVADGYGRRGIGSHLYHRLIPALSACGLHTLLAGIALPNAASVALHERFGFVRAAHLLQVGWKLGQWVDVGYWQLML